MQQTLQRYLTSLEPFLRQEQARGRSYADELAQRRQWADDFANGLGRKLQTRLLG